MGLLGLTALARCSGITTTAFRIKIRLPGPQSVGAAEQS